MNKRYRLVDYQNGKEHISSVVLTREEAIESIRAEAELHASAGWHIFYFVNDDGELVALVCHKQNVVRKIFFREFSAMEDFAA